MTNHARGLCTALVALALTSPAFAKVFFAKQEALKAALPAAEAVEAKDLFLTDGQKQAIEKASGLPLESALVTVYVGRSKGQVVGYAIFDTHVVRTQAETFVVALDPSGTVTNLFVCAFYEPEDYLPAERFLKQFRGRDSGHPPVIGGQISGITGATLTSRAVAGGVRRALAIYKNCLEH